MPPRAQPERLERHVSADFAVIGAGFAGLSAARRLAQLNPGAKIAVLEASRVAEGPAGRNSGFMIDLPHDLSSDNYSGSGQNDLQQIRLNRTGIDFARSAAEEYAMDREIFDPSGKINAAASESGHKHNQDFAEHLEKMDEPSELLDADAMKAVTGSGYFRSGLYTPHTVMLQPAAYIRSMADGLRPVIDLYENSPVVKIRRELNSWKLKTNMGSVAALKVILAVNGHAESFGFFRRRLMHVFTYASMTHAMTGEQVRALGGQSSWAVTPADPMGVTVRRISGSSGNRIVVRSRFSYNPSMEVTDGYLKNVARVHRKKFLDRFPMLSDTGMEYCWGGHLCLSWNNVPAFGEIEEGVYSACCQNGLGTARGTLSGLAAAELCSGVRTETVSTLQSEPEPRRLPPEPIAFLGANALLRWKEWRAGAE
ncbi:NAD(P)/FAD-dependent oxidoreductase [Hoeflea sp. TYP-13]|uniref:NAD(P)/FAD-dependent oxidoreductase n=1 Tax=Hoeflea sp. TYP-13 TaxID=3230023 RepID=UPI0034C6B9A0